LNEEEWKKRIEEVGIENLTKISRILPPLLGNLRTLKGLWKLTAEEQAVFQATEEFLIEFSRRAIGADKS